MVMTPNTIVVIRKRVSVRNVECVRRLSIRTVIVPHGFDGCL